MYELIAETRPIANKEHRCIWCGMSILPGMRYVNEKSIYDGAFQNHHWHIECFENAGPYLIDGDNEFIAYTMQRGSCEERR